MPTMSCVIQVDHVPLSAHGWLTELGERSAWVELNTVDRSAQGPFLGGLGELSLCGAPEAMRRLAEAILQAVDEAERLPRTSRVVDPEPASRAVVVAAG